MKFILLVVLFLCVSIVLLFLTGSSFENILSKITKTQVPVEMPVESNRAENNFRVKTSELRMQQRNPRAPRPSLLSSGMDKDIHTTRNVSKMKKGNPRFQNVNDAYIELDSTKYLCNDSKSAECAAVTAKYADMVDKELNRVVTFESNAYRSGGQNDYNVHFTGEYGRENAREKLLCALGKIRLRTVSTQDEPFADFPIPPAPLHQDQIYNTCAVISSAGAMLGSGHGRFIDSHDAVFRFNNAPTEKYTDDVGSKTTFRILNSQVASKAEFNFTEDPLYSNISIMIWDPAKNSTTMVEWYNAPEHKLFDNYRQFLELNPGADVHVLKPDVLWELWYTLQMSASKRIRKNPPSSGFLGIWLAMHRCATVRVFEYLPSTRASARCHYYSDRQNRLCSVGSWHPLAQEKILANKMRDNSDFEAYQLGFINIPGTVSFSCSE